MLLPPHESTYQGRDLIGLGIEREMSRVENVDFRGEYVLMVAFRLSEIEGEVVLAPKDKEFRLCLLHPGLPFWVGLDVGAIVVEEIALNLRLIGRV